MILATRTRRIAAATFALATIAVVSLSGCAIASTPGEHSTEQSREPAGTPGGSTGSGPTGSGSPGTMQSEPPPLGVAPELEVDPELTLMTDAMFSRVNTVQGLTWARSTPDGTWKVGKGFPVEFPVGLPIYPDRWVDGYPLIIESDGVLMLSYTFWGGYAEVGAIMDELAALGFEVESEILDTRQTHVAENDEFRVVMTVAEGVTDIQEPSRVYDPQYNYIVKFLTVPYSDPEG
jgi:hypothetical protein